MGRARDLARYSATRLALAPLMLWLIASLVFLLLRVAPGDPCLLYTSDAADE